MKEGGLQQWIPHKPETWPFRYAIIKRRLEREGMALDVGQAVKINMVSRLGDFGVTHYLTEEEGYRFRVEAKDMHFLTWGDLAKHLAQWHPEKLVLKDGV